jgi:hypothetical protein
MLVTFSCDVYADTTYFGDIAQSLLKMMGHSGNVPGAILAEDVPKALERLQSAIEELEAASAPNKPEEGIAEQDDWKEKPLTLSHRALPLIELLTAAAKANRNVMWERS